MNTPTDTPKSFLIRLSMSDIDRAALEKDGDKTSVVLAIVPRPELPHAATHAAYQVIHGRNGQEHPRVGHVRFYRSEHIPAEIQTDLAL